MQKSFVTSMNQIADMKISKNQKIKVFQSRKPTSNPTKILFPARVYKDKEKYKDEGSFLQKQDAIEPWNGNQIINKLQNEDNKKKKVQRISNTSHFHRLKQKAVLRYKIIHRSWSQSSDHVQKRKQFKMGSPVIRPQTTAIPFRYDNLLQYLRNKSESRMRKTENKSEDHFNDRENLLNRIFNTNFSPKSSKFKKLNLGSAFVVQEDSQASQSQSKITRIHQKEVKNVYHVCHQNKKANSKKQIEFTTKNIPKSSKIFQKYQVQLF